jgi:hypothetical protein
MPPHAATVSESQCVMRWCLLLEEYRPDIRHISGVENVVADAISRLPMAQNDENESSTVKRIQRQMNEMFNLEQDESNDNGFPLQLSEVQRIQSIELEMRHSKLKALLEDKTSGYSYGEIEGFNLITHKGKMYVQQSLHGRTLGWYHHYLCHPGGDRLANTL